MSMIARMFSAKVNPPKDNEVDFTGRTIITTGSNVGLGLEASVKFVQMGAKKLILAVRSLEKGNAAKKDIETRTGRTGVVEVYQLDMLDYDSIKAFVDKVNRELQQLDIVVLNAGISPMSFEKSQYGWERTLQVNLLSTVLLALLILPKLQESKDGAFTPVLEIVNSGTHIYAKPRSAVLNEQADPLESYNTSQGFSGLTQYAMSKLYLMYAMQELATKVPTKDGEHAVHIVSVCPGATVSELARDLSGPVMGAIKWVMYAALFRTTEQGARTYISGTALGEQGHGRFWTNDKILDKTALLMGTQGAELQARVWSSIVSALSKDVPEVKDLIVQSPAANPICNAT